MKKVWKEQQKQDAYIARHVLEVRFAKKLMPFIDKKGSLLDIFSSKFQLTSYQMSEERIESSDKDQKLKFFFSTVNFGLQTEYSKDFESLKIGMLSLMSILKDESLLHNWPLLRVGVKSDIYYLVKGEDFSALRERFINKFTPGSRSLADELTANIEDVGFSSLNFKILGGANVNLMVGPMQKQQLLEQYFQGDPYNSAHNRVPAAGVFFSADVFQTDELPSLNEIEEQVGEHIETMESVFKRFQSWLSETV